MSLHPTYDLKSDCHDPLPQQPNTSGQFLSAKGLAVTAELIREDEGIVRRSGCALQPDNI